jgi:hypothetical protein
VNLPDCTSFMLDQCRLVKLIMNMTSMENSTSENSREAMRGESGAQRHHRDRYENWERALREGDEEEARRNIGSKEREVTREEVVETEMGEWM